MKNTLPPVPTTREELLIAALRHSDDVSRLLNEIDDEVSRVLGARAEAKKYDRLHDLLRQRFLERSGVFLFIAADDLRLELPEDLQDKGDPDFAEVVE